jgi:hypothetical protein
MSRFVIIFAVYKIIVKTLLIRLSKLKNLKLEIIHNKSSGLVIGRAKAVG